MNTNQKRTLKVLSISLSTGILLSTSSAKADVSQILQTLQSSVHSWDDLESRITKLDADLTSAQSQGKLKYPQVNEFKRQLSTTHQEAVQAKASGRRMSLSQMFQYSNDLNTLAGEIQQSITNSANPTASNRIDDIQNDLKHQIKNNRASGRLTQQDAEIVSRDLQRVSDFEAGAKVANGGILSAVDANRVLRKLERVKASLDQAIVMSDAAVPEINNRKTILRNKLADGVSSGKLSKIQQDQFSEELTRIDRTQSDALIDQHLSSTETLALATALDRLETNIDQALIAAAAPANQTPAPAAPATPPVVSQQPNVPAGTTYADVQGYWGEPYISVLASRGIIGGFPDGTFKPNNEITRAQFAAIASKALNIPPAAGGASFRDVPSTHWAAGVISAVSNKGLVTGFPDGTFRPEDKITRAQALIILAKALTSPSSDNAALQRYHDAGQVPAWAQQSVAAAAAANIIVNFPDPSYIRPENLATRGEVAALTYQTLMRTGRDLPVLTIGLMSTPTTVVKPAEIPVTPAAVPVPEKLFISDVRITPSENVVAGDTITVTAYGSPQANATFSLTRAAQDIPMPEIRTGVYEGTYTVRRVDNVGRPRLAVTLNKKDAQPAMIERQLSFTLDASAPRIVEVLPLPDSTSDIRNPTISARFTDNRGSGIDRRSLTLLINGQDVTSQATIQRNTITFVPQAPLSNRNTAEVRLADQAGNVAKERWSFFIR